MKSDWSTDSDDRKYNQARKIRHEITSDWDTEMKDDQCILVNTPLRRPNTMPSYLDKCSQGTKQMDCH